jgi:maltose-binding protein MalE
MLHGIIYAQDNNYLNTDPGNDFADEVHSYFGTGTQLQELYITPSLLTEKNWDTLAEAAKWSRENASVLKDSHWVGGDPNWLEVYGWASWSPKKGILVLRNPSGKSNSIEIDIAKVFELPADAPLTYVGRSPWKSGTQNAPLKLNAHVPHRFTLAPFEVLTLDLQPN